MNCPTCQEAIPDRSVVCPFCATPLDEAPTSMPAAPREAPSAPPLSLSDSGQHGRFLPGTTLAQRYRIVGLLGRGGMGEVYRADDLKLGQQVALKFLSRSLMQNDAHVARLLDEVRMARKVSHPNVCRVWDIGEADGNHYVSMEYVDGENLASLLRRIGRLPRDKAVEIARQLCAALAAAHDEGVLHRDIKPANIMLDGRGRVKLTDFGLAAVAEVRAGTPIYMAPEQLAGEEVSAQSDLYALGLVLHELFTGKRVFEATDLAELKRQHESAMSESLTSTSDLDPMIERVIERCLLADPKQRPASALGVAAALPGGDPLAAALAAGETPSPEMVAEAGGEGGLSLALAVPLLLAAVIAVFAVAGIEQRYNLLSWVPLELPPAALEARAREIVRDLGYTEEPADAMSGFTAATPFGEGPGVLDWLRDQDAPVERYELLREGRPAEVAFWWRSSPQQLLPEAADLGPGVLGYGAPAFDVRGMVRLRIDTRGRLLHFEALPPVSEAAPVGGAGDTSPSDPTAQEEPAEPTAAPDWSTLFAAADLDITVFRRVSPRFVPPAFADQRAAWEGVYPEAPDIPLRIEAATFASRLVSLRMVSPFAPLEETAEATEEPLIVLVISGLLIAVILAVLFGALLLAQRNVRLGRGDRRGAQRLATVLLVCVMLVWVFNGDHASGFEEVFILFQNFVWALVLAALGWSFYLAAEPLLRRRGPHMLIGWTRLLEGRLGDPLVARDVLVGCAVGALAALVSALEPLLTGRVGPTYQLPPDNALGALGAALAAPVNAFLAFGFFLIYAVLLLIFRNRYVAPAVWIALMTIPPAVISPDNAFVSVPFDVLGWALWWVVLLRFGALAFTVLAFVENFLSFQIIALDLSPWYARDTMVALIIFLGLVVLAFWRAVEWKGSFADVLDQA